MKNYVEITLLPSTDITSYFLWEKVYQKVHLALVEHKGANSNATIGVSFPEYQETPFHLGNKLRLFASSHRDLETLNMKKWLARLTDYVHVTHIREVPDNVKSYACFKRLQLKNNHERLAKRKAKRKGISYQEALLHFKERTYITSDRPFINVKSSSSGKTYRLIITQEKTHNTGVAGNFSTYGLSANYSVPIF